MSDKSLAKLIQKIPIINMMNEMRYNLKMIQTLKKREYHKLDIRFDIFDKLPIKIQIYHNVPHTKWII